MNEIDYKLRLVEQNKLLNELKNKVLEKTKSIKFERNINNELIEKIEKFMDLTDKKTKPLTNDYDFYLKLFFGFLLISFLMFLWYNKGQINNENTVNVNHNDKEKTDKLCYGGYCFRTL